MTKVYPYTFSKSLKEFIQSIPDRGTPPKITIKHIESAGYKSKNDREFVGILKTLEFIDSNGVPTDSYKEYRVKSKQVSVMRKAIRKAYSELYSFYPEAHNQSREVLTDYVAGKTNYSKRVQQAFVTTFLTLCSLADFKSQVVPASQPATITKTKTETVPKTQPKTSGIIPTININIQLVLPDTKDAKTYDKIFESLKKHLLE